MQEVSTLTAGTYPRYTAWYEGRRVGNCDVHGLNALVDEVDEKYSGLATWTIRRSNTVASEFIYRSELDAIRKGSRS